jgi:hypothetical protein
MIGVKATLRNVLLNVARKAAAAATAIIPPARILTAGRDLRDDDKRFLLTFGGVGRIDRAVSGGSYADPACRVIDANVAKKAVGKSNRSRLSL